MSRLRSLTLEVFEEYVISGFKVDFSFNYEMYLFYSRALNCYRPYGAVCPDLRQMSKQTEEETNGAQGKREYILLIIYNVNITD